MNKQRILQLADHIEQQPHTEWNSPSGFNMIDYVHHCGSPCCIAGHALALKGESTRGLTGSYIAIEAAEWLGLTTDKASRLFVPATIVRNAAITPLEAASVLRNLAKTGNVDWDTFYGKR